MNEKLTAAKRTLLFAVCYLAYTAVYVVRLNLSIASVELTQLSASDIGNMGTAFAVVYALGRFFSGSVCDRLPPWIPVVTGLGLAGLCNVLIGFLPPAWLMIVLWGLNAAGQSLLWGAMLQAMSAVYPPETVKKKTSLLVTTVATGNVLGILFGMWMISLFDVRFAFFVPGAVALAVGVLALVFLRRIPAPPAVSRPVSPLRSVASLLREKSVLAMLTPTFMHGLVKDNVSLFIALYYASVYGVDLKKIALFSIIVPAVGFAGRMAYPFLYRLTGEREHTVSLLSFAVATLSAVPLLFGGKLHPVAAAVCMSLIYAFLSIYNTTALSVYPLEFKATGQIAQVSGFMDLAAYLGSAAGSQIYGRVIDAAGFSPMIVLWLIFSATGMVFTVFMAKNEWNDNKSLQKS